MKARKMRFKALKIITLLMLLSLNKFTESYLSSTPSSFKTPKKEIKIIISKKCHTMIGMQQSDDSSSSNENKLYNRRKVMNSFVQFSTLMVSSKALAEDVEIRGTKIDSFNGLIFNYRGNDFNGLDSSTLNEPSISYAEFLDKLDKGDVQFVKFLAPDGDVAYATIKDMEKPIRIGEGYPIEQHDGWSSPTFAIRSVKEKGVPYKFIVPGLDAYK